MKTYFLVLLMLSSLVAACGGAPKKTVEKPDWVNGASSRYPSALYLIGRAQYKHLDGAKDRARADLAKTFEVVIKDDSKDLQAYSMVKSGDQIKENLSEQKVTRNINTSTEQIVRGVQIGDVWQDPVSGDHYALAILSRMQAAEALRQEITRLDEITRNNIDTAANSDDVLEKIGKAHRALNAQIERLAFQRTLQVVDDSGQGMRPAWNLAALQSDVEKLLKRTVLRPIVTNDDSGQLKDVLAGAVSTAGFTPGEGGEADFILATALSLEDLGRREGWYWTQGTLEIKLTDKGGKVRGTKRWPIKTSSQEKVLVKQRAKDEVARVLGKELRATLVGFGSGT